MLDPEGVETAPRTSSRRRGRTQTSYQGAIISRVLSPRAVSLRTGLRWQPFIWAGDCSTALAANPGLSARNTPTLPCGGRETPIRPCSGWGLPCGCRCRPPGALLPHPFTLACPLRERRAIGGLLSVALSLAPPESGTGGRYPPPLFRGARTFLALSHAAASGPLTGRPIGVMPSKY